MLKKIPFLLREGANTKYLPSIEKLGLGPRLRTNLMGKISNEGINKIVGKVGNVIYYELNGKTCVRSFPSTYRDKKSEKQLHHRQRFATVGKLYVLFHSAIRFDVAEKNQNQTSTFFKLNWEHVTVEMGEVHINYEKLVLCNQVHFPFSNFSKTILPSKVMFEWGENKAFDDSFRVLCAVYCKGINQVYITEVKRNSLSATVFIPPNTGDIYTYTYQKKYLRVIVCYFVNYIILCEEQTRSRLFQLQGSVSIHSV